MDTAEVKKIAARLARAIPKQANGADRAEIYVALARDLGLTHLLHPDAVSDEGEPDLPLKAPKLYRKRTDRRERPHEFIARVYKPWLGNGLAQHHLLNLDRPLYFALHNWLLKNEMPDWLDLPSKKEVHDRELKQLGWSEGDPLPSPPYYKALKKKLSLYNAARNRKG